MQVRSLIFVTAVLILCAVPAATSGYSLYNVFTYAGSTAVAQPLNYFIFALNRVRYLPTSVAVQDRQGELIGRIGLHEEWNTSSVTYSEFGAILKEIKSMLSFVF